MTFPYLSHAIAKALAIEIWFSYLKAKLITFPCMHLFLRKFICQGQINLDSHLSLYRGLLKRLKLFVLVGVTQ